jgi:uncharacterized protein (DUF924 family)
MPGTWLYLPADNWNDARGHSPMQRTLFVDEVPADWVKQLLSFWFEKHGEEHWFGGGSDFDGEVRDRFADWREALRSQPVEAFLTDADTALAAALLFDQVPRNVYRGGAEAFATDDAALGIAREAVRRGLDDGLPADQRLFLYLPFEHSEEIGDQRESLRLMAALDNAAWLDFAQKHFAMIDRFGRFPHRNAALGRADRPGEAEAVAAGGRW